MTDREKLVELISDFVVHVPHEEGQTWEEACADHLISNGVTFEKDTDVHGKWISVSERLPENRDYVLVCTKNKFYGTRNISKAYFGDGKWYGQGGRWTNVTHWMPLPEPPKEDSNGK